MSCWAVAHLHASTRGVRAIARTSSHEVSTGGPAMYRTVCPRNLLERVRSRRPTLIAWDLDDRRDRRERGHGVCSIDVCEAARRARCG